MGEYRRDVEAREKLKADIDAANAAFVVFSQAIGMIEDPDVD